MGYPFTPEEVGTTGLRCRCVAATPCAVQVEFLPVDSAVVSFTRWVPRAVVGGVLRFPGDEGVVPFPVQWLEQERILDVLHGTLPVRFANKGDRLVGTRPQLDAAFLDIFE